MTVSDRWRPLCSAAVECDGPQHPFWDLRGVIGLVHAGGGVGERRSGRFGLFCPMLFSLYPATAPIKRTADGNVCFAPHALFLTLVRLCLGGNVSRCRTY
jgi:hypothetical protein